MLRGAPGLRKTSDNAPQTQQKNAFTKSVPTKLPTVKKTTNKSFSLKTVYPIEFIYVN